MGFVLKAIKLLTVISLVLVFITVVTEVLCRYVLHLSIPWGAEFSQTLLVWSTFLGSSYALFYKEHMSITLFINRIKSKKIHKAIDIGNRFVLIVFLIVGIVAGARVTALTWGDRTTAMQIPAGILYLSFPVSCTLMVIFVMLQILQLWREDK